MIMETDRFAVLECRNWYPFIAALNGNDEVY